jgi:outer membrane usher protein
VQPVPEPVPVPSEPVSPTISTTTPKSDESSKQTTETPASTGGETQVKTETKAEVELPPATTEVEVPAMPVPEVPSSLTATMKRSIPAVPTMFEPFVCTQEDYEMFYAAPAETTTNEEDPFADFYVAGEEQAVTFEDGVYYLALYVNDEYVGDLETKFAGGEKLVNMTEFSNYVGGMLTEASSSRILGGNDAYLSIEDLKQRGVDITFDSTAFALYAKIEYTDLSVRVLSVSTQNGANKRDRYTLTGAVDLPPAKFSWVASTSLYGSVTYPSDFSKLSSQSYTLYVNNSLAFWGLGLDFSYSIYNTSPYYTIGNWTAFHDFVDKNERLTFGSVGSNLSARTPDTIDTNIGVMLEKSYSYGTGTALGNQFQYTIDIIEPSKLDIYINPDDTDATKVVTPVFTRQLQAGTYRLKDFVFTQGANKIKMVITPDSRPNDPEIYYIDTSYDSRLLGKGDTLFGFTLSMPRGNTKDESKAGGLFHFKDYIRQSYLSYYPQYATARYWQNIGLTDTFTFALDVSATPGIFSGTFNGVWANAIGTTQAQGTLKFNEMYAVPLFSGSLTERFNDKFMQGFGSLSLSFSYNTPAARNTNYSNPSTGSTNTSDLASSMVGSFSFSARGLVTKLRYSLSGSVSYTVGNAYPTWSMSASTGFTLFKGFSVSGSMTVSGSDNTNPGNAAVTATISGSYSFSPKVNASSSTTLGTKNEATTSVGLSYRPTNNDNLSLTMSSFRFSDPLNHSLLASWSHSGKVSSLTLRQQISSKYQQMTTSVNLSTAFAFVDGAFGMARSIGNTFLLVKPEGELKHSQISVARSMDSSPQIIPKYLGSSLFNSISPYVKNNVVVYGGGEDSYATSTSFMYQFTPGGRQAYLVKIDLPPTYTVSGVITHADGSVYEQYSSPIYRVTYDETGKETLTQDPELYLFTDQEGRYIISFIGAGDYSFDLQIGENSWYAVKFTVPVMTNKKLRVVDYGTMSDAGPYDEKGYEGYDETMTLNVETQMTEEDFWNKIFPAAE